MIVEYSHKFGELFSYPKHDSQKYVNVVQCEWLFLQEITKMNRSVTYSSIHAQVGMTEWDLSWCSGLVPKLQQLLVQRGFLYGETKVAIGALRVNTVIEEHFRWMQWIWWNQCWMLICAIAHNISHSSDVQKTILVLQFSVTFSYFTFFCVVKPSSFTTLRLTSQLLSYTGTQMMWF